MKDFFTAIKERRTIYKISNESPVADERIQEIISGAVKHAPSAFNSQSARVIVLLGEQHDKLWDITKETLKKIVPAENFASTSDKINSFRNGYGTVLYFEDISVVEDLQTRFPLYRENFPLWSLQSSGMLQYIIWTALEIDGFGASLQHYNPLIDDEIKQAWNIPQNWKLLAQMPFGRPAGNPDEKQFLPLEGRLKIYK